MPRPLNEATGSSAIGTTVISPSSAIHSNCEFGLILNFLRIDAGIEICALEETLVLLSSPLLPYNIS